MQKVLKCSKKGEKEGKGNVMTIWGTVLKSIYWNVTHPNRKGIMKSKAQNLPQDKPRQMEHY